MPIGARLPGEGFFSERAIFLVAVPGERGASVACITLSKSWAGAQRSDEHFAAASEASLPPSEAAVKRVSMAGIGGEIIGGG